MASATPPRKLTASVTSVTVPGCNSCTQGFPNVSKCNFDTPNRLSRNSDLAYGVVIVASLGDESHPLRQPFKLQDFLRLSHRLSHFLRHFSLTFPTAQYLSLREKRRGQDSESLTDGEVQSERQVEEPSGSDLRQWTHQGNSGRNVLFTIQPESMGTRRQRRSPGDGGQTAPGDFAGRNHRRFGDRWRFSPHD